MPKFGQLTATVLIRIKDLCGWYGISYKSMRRTLKAEGIIPASDHGKGNRHCLALSTLAPFFRKYGRPPGITLSLEF